MCDWEVFQYTECSHEIMKRLSYCHFARNDPYHQCFGVKVVKNRWTHRMYCPPCGRRLYYENKPGGYL